MLKKIISGGQIGADQAALDVAIKMGIAHGGWIQKGRKTQSGFLPKKYNLKEMPTASFIKRIEQNVVDADGTVIVSHGRLSGGANYSQKMTTKHKRPCLHIDLSIIPIFIAASRINAWVKEHNIEVLNVTGSRASEDPKIYNETMLIIENAILLGLGRARSGEQLLDYDIGKDLHKLSKVPKTVDAAIAEITAAMPLHERVKMANLEKEELTQTSFSLGVYIKEQWFRKDTNRELFESCLDMSGKDQLNENAAADVIIQKLWQRLRATHRLRVVK